MLLDPIYNGQKVSKNLCLHSIVAHSMYDRRQLVANENADSSMGTMRTERGNPAASQCEAMSTVPPSTSVVHLAAATVSTSACDAPCIAAICMTVSSVLIYLTKNVAM